MECFITCLYLGLGMAYAKQAATPPCPPPRCGWVHDITEVKNPFGVVELGWSVESGKWTTDIALRHESSMAYGHDRGFNSAEIRVRFKPWGAR